MKILCLKKKQLETDIKQYKADIDKLTVCLAEKEDNLKKLEQQLNEEREQRKTIDKLYNKKLNPQIEKINELQKELDRTNSELEQRPQMLEKLDILKYMNCMANRAWHGKHSEMEIKGLDGTVILKLDGHTYEPHYEDFSSTCAVYGFEGDKHMVLFDENDYNVEPYHNEVETTGSIDNIRNYLKKHNQYVILE